MAKYRVIDSSENVVEEKEFDDATGAYDWFKTVAGGVSRSQVTVKVPPVHARKLQLGGVK